MKTTVFGAFLLLLVGAHCDRVLAQSNVGEPLGQLFLSEEPNAENRCFELFPMFQLVEVYLVADIDFGHPVTGAQTACRRPFARIKTFNLVTVNDPDCGMPVARESFSTIKAMF